jgi:hypothetical protein
MDDVEERVVFTRHCVLFDFFDSAILKNDSCSICGYIGIFHCPDRVSTEGNVLGIYDFSCLFDLFQFNPVLDSEYERKIQGSTEGQIRARKCFAPGGLSVLSLYRCKHSIGHLENARGGGGKGKCLDFWRRDGRYAGSYVEKHIYPGDQYNLGFIDYNAHNQFFQFLIALGALGLIWFLGILTFLFMKSIREHRTVLTFLLMLFSSFCLTESALCAQKGIVFFMFFASLLATDILREVDSPENKSGATTFF